MVYFFKNGATKPWGKTPDNDAVVEEEEQQMDANDLIKNRNKKKNYDDFPEGISDIDSINDTKSMHNRSQFNSKQGYQTKLTNGGSNDSSAGGDGNTSQSNV